MAGCDVLGGQVDRHEEFGAINCNDNGALRGAPHFLFFRIKLVSCRFPLGNVTAPRRGFLNKIFVSLPSAAAMYRRMDPKREPGKIPSILE